MNKAKTLDLFSCLLVTFIAVKIFYMSANIISFSIAANIPNECRDLVQYRIVRAFMNFTNPYSLSAFNSGTVPLGYMYTFLQPLLVAAACKLSGWGVIEGNLFVNMLCVLGTALCIWIIVKDTLGISTQRGGGINLL